MTCGLEQVLPLVPFKVVTLTPQGKQASAEQKEARLRVEDLGKGVSLEMVAIPGGCEALKQKGCCGAVPGTSIRGVVAQRFVSGTTQTSGTTSSGFGLPVLPLGLFNSPFLFSANVLFLLNLSSLASYARWRSLHKVHSNFLGFCFPSFWLRRYPAALPRVREPESLRTCHPARGWVPEDKERSIGDL